MTHRLRRPTYSSQARYITPLLKKTGLDANTAANYRPVSNLCVLSKTAGKDRQSAYRRTPAKRRAV